MTQNVYDQEPFFEAYSVLPRSKDGLSSAPEWPTLQPMLGNLSGRKLLDLGCGYGYFARWACTSGAKSVRAIDISERMLSRAREFDTDASITYAVQDLEVLSLTGAEYDVVYSSLTLHYIHDLERLFHEIYNALPAGGGKFVFSVEHPIFTAPKAATPGFLQHAGGTGVYWPLDGYAEEGSRNKHWIGQDVVKVHRTIGTYVQLLIRCGFAIADLVEWMPSLKDIEEHPDWQSARERPMFLLLSAQKP
jgi:SAM-dependent methyltransferase